MPDPFTIAGLAATGLGALGNLFGKSEEDQRRDRFNEYLQMVRALRQDAQRRALRQTGGMIQQATAGAGRRAFAAGRGGDVEAYILPAQQQAIRTGTRAVEQATAPYDSAMIRGGIDFYNRPIARNRLSSFLTEIGSVGAQYGLGREGIAAQEADIMPGTMTHTPGINPDVEAEIGAIRRRRNTLSLGG